MDTDQPGDLLDIRFEGIIKRGRAGAHVVLVLMNRIIELQSDVVEDRQLLEMVLLHRTDGTKLRGNPEQGEPGDGHQRHGGHDERDDQPRRDGAQHGQATNRYPVPRMLSIGTGAPARSSFLRRRVSVVSRTVLPGSNSSAQTCLSRSALETTSLARRIRYSRRENSRDVRSMACAPWWRLRARRSSTNPPADNSRCWTWRRSRARILASSSANANGFL